MPLPVCIIISVIAVKLAAIITMLVIRYLSQKKDDNFVLHNSVCLKQLDEINRRYKFYPDISFDQRHTYDNEKFYNSISCKDYLIYQLQYIRKDVFNQINNIKVNKQRYSKYLDEINAVTEFGKFLSPIEKLDPNKLIYTEMRLMKKHTLAAPAMEFRLTVTLRLSKKNGEIYSRKRETFFTDDIYVLNKRLNNKKGNFYNDRGIWDALCRVERGKVSNKMRFSIYKRDGYRCRKCGASGQYAQLEIDHIIPIAKGGKSTYDNLQTLCHKCNVNKGANLY